MMMTWWTLGASWEGPEVMVDSVREQGRKWAQQLKGQAKETYYRIKVNFEAE